MSKGTGDEMIYFVEDDLSDANSYTEAQAADLGTTTSMNHPHLSNYGDSVLIVWEHTDQGETDIWFNFSTDGMTSWQSSTAAPVFELSGVQNKPDVIIGTDASIHLVYHDTDLDRIMYTKGNFSSVGTNELELAQFSVHPNPTKTQLTLDGINPSSRYTISDAKGSVFLAGYGNEVDVQQLAPGLYFGQVEGYQQQKFVVK